MGIGKNWPSNGLFMALRKAGYKITGRSRLSAFNGRIAIHMYEKVLDMDSFSVFIRMSVNGKETLVPDTDENGWTLWLIKLELRGGV